MELSLYLFANYSRVINHLNLSIRLRVLFFCLQGIVGIQMGKVMTLIMGLMLSDINVK